jgi:hypothetical protein
MSAIVKVERQGAGAVFRAKLAPNCAGERDENMLHGRRSRTGERKQSRRIQEHLSVHPKAQRLFRAALP